MAAALVLLAATPLVAQDNALEPGATAAPASKPKPKKKGAAANAAQPDATLAPAATAAPSSSPTPAPAVSPAPTLAPPTAKSKDALSAVAGLSLDAPVDPLIPLPLLVGVDDLDLTVLVNKNLCVLPFIKDDSVSSAPDTSGTSLLDRIQSTFFEAAQRARKGDGGETIKLGPSSKGPDCTLDDTACMARRANENSCAAILGGFVRRVPSGFDVGVRFVDATHSTSLAKVDDLIASNSESNVLAWAEGLACRALKGKCNGQMRIDVDLPGIKVLINNVAFTPKQSWLPNHAEVLHLVPGVYKLRASTLSSDSGEVLVPVRAAPVETVYVRQLSNCRLPVRVTDELKLADAPGPSAAKCGTIHPGRVVAIVAAGLGVVAEGLAAQQFFHSQSLANSAANDYTANGYYKAADLASISSAKTAHTNSTIFTAVGAGLIVVGGVLFFAF